MLDPVVATGLAAGRVFQTVQRTLARQRRTAPAAAFEIAGQQGQQGVVAQLVMVIEVLVSQRDPRDPLRHQGIERVLHETGIAVVRKAGRHLAEETHGPLELPEQQRSGVRRHRSAVEPGGHLPPLAPLKRE